MTSQQAPDGASPRSRRNAAAAAWRSRSSAAPCSRSSPCAATTRAPTRSTTPCARLPGLSRTTVYRVLDTLVDQGFARKVQHTGAVVRFDAMTERHHHLVCERCGRLVDLDDASVPSLPLPDVRGTGFRVRDYSISFTGLCKNCR